MSERMGELLGERRVAPSILSADFGRLGAQVAEVMDAGARVIHFDVMDGHFVPPITIGPLVLGGIADQVHEAGGVVDVHLMIEAPERQVERVRQGRAPTRSPSTRRRRRTPTAPCTRSASSAAWPAIAINPGTPVEAVAELRGLADIVLCMTRQPGLGRPVVHPEPRRTRSSAWRRWSAPPRSRSTAASTPRPPARSPPPAPSSSSPARAVFGAPDPAAAYTEIAEAAGAT